MFNTPILFIIFNRLDTAQQVFAQIKKVQPAQLFIAADGPRMNIKGDSEKCETVRNWVVKNVDWNCEIKVLFQENNLGCGLGPVTGINWFFQNVEEGIILEDDTLVDVTFFHFCNELLPKYRDNLKVKSISATNLMANKMSTINDSYLFSFYGGNWGWASWRRSWIGFDFNLEDWRFKNTHFLFIRKYGYRQYLFFKSIFDLVAEGKRKDIWDYQWWFYLLKTSSLTIIPATNLLKNIGFGDNATHTLGQIDPRIDVPVVSLVFPLKHPGSVDLNLLYENKIIKTFYSLKINTKQKLKKTIEVIKFFATKIKIF